MALRFSILFSIRDAKGATATTEMGVPDTVSLANLTAFAAALAPLINDIIKGAITRIGLVLAIDLPGGLRTTPDATSDVEEGARFQFSTENGFYSSMRLPTFDEQFIVAGSNAVDLEDADVDAFTTAMLEGITVNSTLVEPVDIRGEDLVAMRSAKESFLSSRGRVA